MSTDPLEILDSSAEAVEAMTGIKRQFIDAGWSETNAELMVLEMYRMATIAQRAKLRGSQ